MTYIPIHVSVAQHMADGHGKDIVLIVGWDLASNRTNIVTWGREPAQKVAAAKAGETIAKQLGLADELADVHEDFRREGEAAKVVDELRRKLAAIRDALAEIVISEGEDAGVILLSDESPNFSPLGDALVSVARLAAESVSVPSA